MEYKNTNSISTKEWNEQYKSSSILKEGNRKNIYSFMQDDKGLGERDNLAPALAAPLLFNPVGLAIAGSSAAMLGGYYLYEKLANENTQKALLQMAKKGDGKNQKNNENETQEKNEKQGINSKNQEAKNKISELRHGKRKTRVQGGGGLRERRVDKKGNIFEKDYQHSKEGRLVWEKYNSRGEHLGEFDDDGNKLKNANKSRRIEP